MNGIGLDLATADAEIVAPVQIQALSSAGDVTVEASG